jgi:hypothetical protein
MSPRRLLASFTFRQPCLLLLIFVVSLQVHVLFGGATIQPHTFAGVTPRGSYGYSGPFPQRHITIDPAAASEAEFGWAAYMVRAFKDGTIPWWNPYQGLGQPFLNNPLIGVLYPINWLTLVLPLAWWDLVCLLQWLLTAYFVQLFTRWQGIERPAALVAGLGVLVAGYFQAYLPVRSVMGSAVWFPCSLYAVERTLRQPEWRWRPIVISASTYCLAVAGHPEPALIAFGLLVLYVLVRNGRDRRLWSTTRARILPAVLAGALLAAPLWLLFADYLFVDKPHVAHLPNHGLLHFPWQTTAALLFPYLYGPLNQDIWSGAHAAMGWFPTTLSFLALAGLFELVRSRHRGGIAVAVGGALAVAKLFGLPLVNDIGRLPVLDQFWFQYASGPLAVNVCVLAAFGFRYLLRSDGRGLVRLGVTWAALVVTLLVIGIYTLHQHAPALTANVAWLRACLTALAVGVFWAVTAPVAMLLARIWNGTPASLSCVTIAALVTQALACLPNGSPRGYQLANAGAALLFLLISGGALLSRSQARNRMLMVATAAGVALVTAIGWTIAPGLPARYDALTPAPYVKTLRAGANSPRIYGFDGVLFPDFAAPLGLSSVTNLEVVTPIQVTEFFWKYLDPGADPARFYGTMAARVPGARTPHDEFASHKRYWDLIGTKYLLATSTSVEGRVVVDAQPESVVGTPVPLSQSLDAHVSCPPGGFSSARVLLSTYTQVQPGQVTLQVLDERGAEITATQVDSATLADNAIQTFQLPVPACTSGSGSVTLRLSYQPGRPNAIIAAWQYPSQPEVGFSFEALQPSEIRLVARDQRTGIGIYENDGASERAFLAPEAVVVRDWRTAQARLGATLDLQRTVYLEEPQAGGCQVPESSPITSRPGRLDSIVLEPNRVDIRYHANVPGVLTLTDTWLRGWSARVNGQQVPVLRVDGTFRGVCLNRPGEHSVTFYYRPPLWSASLVLCGSGAAWILAAAITCRRTRAESPTIRKPTRGESEMTAY